MLQMFNAIQINHMKHIVENDDQIHEIHHNNL